jgi:hypothetical protein
MFTSCFRLAKQIPAGLEPVAVSIGIPKWYTGRRELRLAPTRAMLKMPAAEYDRLFAERLASLDPADVAQDLGANAVLLCWEKPGQACHRRIAAEWLEHHLGIVVPELGVDRFTTGWQTTRDYAHWRPEGEARATIEVRLASQPAQPSIVSSREQLLFEAHTPHGPPDVLPGCLRPARLANKRRPASAWCNGRSRPHGSTSLTISGGPLAGATCGTSLPWRQRSSKRLTWASGSPTAKAACTPSGACRSA